MGKRHWSLVSLTVVAVLAGMLAGCGGGASREEATPTPYPTPVVPTKPTYTVQRGPIAEQVKFTGRIAAVEEEQLYFKTDGRVAVVNVKQGDKVKAGDILAELEISDLLNQLAQAKVSLETAQMQLRSAEASSGESETRAAIDLEIARLRLAQAKSQDPTTEVEIARQHLEQAKNSLWSAQASRDSTCAEGRGSDCDSAQAQVQSAEASVRIAELGLQQVLQGLESRAYDLKIMEQNVRLAELNYEKAAAGEADSVMAQDVARAQLVVDRLEAQVADARLTAPFDGDVTMVGAYAGRTVTAYRPVINVAAPGALEISADLTSETMAQLSIGQACSVNIVNYPTEEFHGSVRRLPYPYGTGGSSSAGTAEEDRSTRISIDDAGGVELEKGALVRVTVTLQEKDDVLWLPPEAIRTFQGKDFVLVIEGEGQRRVPVKVGIKAEDRVELESGVTEGQVVVGP